MVLIDTHCHLNHRDFDGDREDAVTRALGAGVLAAVVIGWDEDSSRSAVDLASSSPHLWATVGIHPQEAAASTTESFQRIEELAMAPRVVAIGEVGLDFYREQVPHDVQERVFRKQAEIALAAGLPVVVHTRNSTAAALQLLFDYRGEGLKAVLHCWSGTAAEADQVASAGWWIGIGGVLTFKNAPDLHAVAASAPPESLLLETDAPYLAPQPRRGRRNEPSYLPWIAERLGELRNVSIAGIDELTTANARAAFPGLKM